MANLGIFRDDQRLFEGAASVVSPGAAANSSCLERLIGAERPAVHRQRDPLLACAANADPVHARLQLPSAGHLMSQHLPTWDEWSSPGELIHPGDLPRTSSTMSGAAKNYLRVGYSQPHSHGWPRPGSYLSRRSPGANRESGQLLFGLPQSRGRQHHINRFTTRSVWKQMTGDTAIRDDDC